MIAAQNSDYVVSLVVHLPGLILPRDPFSVGAFEFTKAPDPIPGCEVALAQSMAAFDLASQEPMRMRTFIKDCTSDHAIRVARLYGQEALALMRLTLLQLGGDVSLSEAGYCLDLNNGHPQPTLPRQSYNPIGIIAVMDNIAHHPDLTLNTLLSADPRHFGELGQALRRSTHWRRLVDETEDYSQRLLLRWMACETLTRVDPNESLTPKLLSALGFVSGRYGLQLAGDDNRALGRVPRYRPWRRQLTRLVERVRQARNAVAHSGFREVDLGGYFSEDERLTVSRVFRMLIPRLQGLAFDGLALRIRSLREFWRRFGECMHFQRTIPIATEVGGTVIFGLEQPRGPLDDE